MPLDEAPTFVEQLETPCALVDVRALDRNLNRLADASATAGIAVRPHVKTHKCPAIAIQQIAAGAIGITCATLAEAAGMIAAGIESVLVYYPIVDEATADRLLDLRRRADLSATVESPAGADLLDGAARRRGIELGVLIDVDTGLGRTGVTLDGLDALARHIETKPALRLIGIGTHEGFSYAIGDPDERDRIVGERLGEFAAAGQRLGVGTVSCGSTPSLSVALRTDGITEVRPGNYALLDRVQIGLGVAKPEDCAFTVLSTVISVRDRSRMTVDAGSKALSSDRGVHGGAQIDGHGLVRDQREIRFPALSEEHGFVAGATDPPAEVGDRLRIVPNHSCAAVANFGAINLVDGDEVVAVADLTGRRGVGVLG